MLSQLKNFWEIKNYGVTIAFSVRPFSREEHQRMKEREREREREREGGGRFRRSLLRSMYTIYMCWRAWSRKTSSGRVANPRRCQVSVIQIRHLGQQRGVVITLARKLMCAGLYIYVYNTPRILWHNIEIYVLIFSTLVNCWIFSTLLQQFTRSAKDIWLPIETMQNTGYMEKKSKKKILPIT